MYTMKKPDTLISADPYEQPETEEFYIEGNKVEISDADDVYEPVKVKKEACLSEEETTSPHDATHIKKKPASNDKHAKILKCDSFVA
ncbi:uncharacterized protein LOC126292313 isoform X2 [Schistocerca gregaria]|uniref:uncharacterized protein LOC126292313 isoform X2 n=1 Tax=Schistocerca gregaria TaxID=7010 RepID=UPI00211F3E57|nr:uncharacterized protein LOC126292313 isoform X2 [Schistocerca gregaria]